MSLYNDLSTVLTPYANKIKRNESDISAIKADLSVIVSYNYTVGKNIYVYGANVSIIDDNAACLSDYIPLTWESGYLSFLYSDDTEDSNSYYISFYDDNKNRIGTYVRNPVPERFRRLTYDTQYIAGTAYARFSFKKGFAGRIEINNTPVYEAGLVESEIYDIKQDVGKLSNLMTETKNSLVGSINEVYRKIPNLPLEPSSTSFFHVSKNLIDPDRCELGYFVNQTNGNIGASASHVCTGYIPVSAEKLYMMRYINNSTKDMRICYYTASKTYISGNLYSGQSGPKIVTAPANAEYVRLSMNSTTPLDMMFSAYEESDNTDFEAFDNSYILKKYIQKESLDDVPLNLPPKIYALVGYETNIYFENLTEDWEKYHWDVTCSKGMQLERGFRVTPEAGDTGTYNLTITMEVDGISKSAQASLIITATGAGNGTTKSVIILGDSTTNNGIVIEKLNANFADDVMSVTTLGTRGTSPNNHEGRSGWKWETYFTTEYIDYTDGRGHVENPFYNPTSQTFDADYYFTNSGVSKPDWFILNLGINDVFGYTLDSALTSAISTVLEYYADAVDSILDSTTTTKVGVCVTIPPNHSQDAFGKAYKCGQTRDRAKRNNALFAQALISAYSGRENERIYLIPIHAALDTVYNMGMESLPVNARNTDVTYQSPITNGGVHPVASGYWQIADVYTAFLKSNA